jgi:putative hemolysin
MKTDLLRNFIKNSPVLLSYEELLNKIAETHAEEKALEENAYSVVSEDLGIQLETQSE